MSLVELLSPTDWRTSLPARSPSTPRGLSAVVHVHRRRLALLRYISLSDHGVSVGEMAEAFGLTAAAVRLHLAKLVACGLVEEKRTSPTGPGRRPIRYHGGVAAEELLSWDGLRAFCGQGVGSDDSTPEP